MLPIKLPLNSTACTADQRLVLVPNEYCCVEAGVTDPTVLDPATLKSVPTNSFLAMPTPPLILTAPVPILALSVVPCTIKFALVCIEPATSNASAGDNVLIPTFSVESILITFFCTPKLLTLKSIGAPDVKLVTTPDVPCTSNVTIASCPTCIPELLLIVNFCDDVLATSLLKKLLAATLAPDTTKFSAFSLVPRYFATPSLPIFADDKFKPG